MAPVWFQVRLPLSPVIKSLSGYCRKYCQILPGTRSWAGCGHPRSCTRTSESGRSPPGPPSGSTRCPAPGRTRVLENGLLKLSAKRESTNFSKKWTIDVQMTHLHLFIQSILAIPSMEHLLNKEHKMQNKALKSILSPNNMPCRSYCQALSPNT